MSQLVNKAKNFVSDKISDVAKPEASLTDVDFTRVTMNNVEYLAKVFVLGGEREIASGIIPDPGSLKAKDTTMVDVPVKVPYSILMSLAKDIGADWDIDYQLDVGLVIDLPVVGNFTIPLSRKGEVKLPSPF
ncbi:hypothetical protein KIW84_045346 [Lathyrus oleraceus]|uniref:Water stress and hypersensitive response domain-containing protein n=1 Tax=Pisum sativum TaxID=3888 RepID=A0A9D5ARM0_PEA|nr:hypothetical protein KIW84_045346 [Pisum sativum]